MYYSRVSMGLICGYSASLRVKSFSSIGQTEFYASLLVSIISCVFVSDHINNPLRRDCTATFHILLGWLQCSKAENSWKDQLRCSRMSLIIKFYLIDHSSQHGTETNYHSPMRLCASYLATLSFNSSSVK